MHGIFPQRQASNPTTAATLQPTGSAAAISTAGWKTYMNFTYEFAIAYPPTMIAVPNTWMTRLTPSGPLCNYGLSNASQVACFFLPQGTYPDTTNTNFSWASLAVSIIDLDQQDCLSFSDFELERIGEPTPNTINGIKFFTILTGGYALGQGRSDVRNRTLAHNTCFDLTTAIGFTSYWAPMTETTSTPEIKPFTEVNERNIQAILDRMLSTFRFTSDFVSTPSS